MSDTIFSDNTVDTNPKIAEKAKIVIGFYEKINLVFNESYFRALAY